MKNPAFDAYIAKSAEFARPILQKVRELFHQACPNVKETMKWSFPHFGYKGALGSMAAFKDHVAWGFSKAMSLPDPDGILDVMGDTATSRGKVADVSQLPPDKVMLKYIHKAMALNEKGINPDYFVEARKRNKKALAAFQGRQLAKLVGELYLSEGKKEKERLWTRARAAMRKAGVPQERLESLFEKKDASELALLVQELVRAAEPRIDPNRSPAGWLADLFRGRTWPNSTAGSR